MLGKLLGPSLEDAQATVEEKYNAFLENKGLCEAGSSEPLPFLSKSNIRSPWQKVQLSDKALKALAKVLDGKATVTHAALRKAMSTERERVWTDQLEHAQEGNGRFAADVLKKYVAVPDALTMRSFSRLGEDWTGAYIDLSQSPLRKWNVSLNTAGGLIEFIDEYTGGRDVDVNYADRQVSRALPHKDQKDTLIQVVPVAQHPLRSYELVQGGKIPLKFSTAANLVSVAIPEGIKITHDDPAGNPAKALMKVFPDNHFTGNVLSAVRHLIGQGGQQGDALSKIISERHDADALALDFVTASLARVGFSALQAHSVSELKTGIYIPGASIYGSANRLGRARQILEPRYG